MSYEESLVNFSEIADGDQSANQYKFMALGTDGVSLQTTAGGISCGVLQNKPEDTQAATIAFSGISKVAAGAAVAKGANVQADATGRAVAAAAADYSQGIALAAATAAGQIIPVLLRPQAQLN